MTETVDTTVIICTRNRSRVFSETCRSLLDIEDDGLSWELVLVDNDSQDDTREVALAFRQRFDRPVQIVVEETVGLSSARNTGIRSARGRFLVFLDDDAFPAQGWLPSLVEQLRIDNVYAVGGPVEPRFASDLPGWFSDRFLPYLTVWDLGPEIVELRYNEYPRGANMAFRREAFDRFGLFSHHLGRKATSLLSCEETELCLRIERGGGSIRYVPGARVEHRVDGARVSRDWLVSRFGSQGHSEAIVEWQHAGLRGLGTGLRRSLRRAVQSSRSKAPEERLVRDCEWSTLRGYLKGLLTAPATVPRYKPSPESGPAAKWSPFE